MKARIGQKSITFKGKRYKVFCECNAIWKDDVAKHEVRCDLPSIDNGHECADCEFYAWIRLGKSKGGRK